jgi:hypothetical protein
LVATLKEQISLSEGDGGARVRELEGLLIIREKSIASLQN